MTPDPGCDVVTGAFSYTGRFIARLLLQRGRSVRTLTGHPDRRDPLGSEIDVRPFRFDDPVQLARSLEGADTLYNTYWVRFRRGRFGFEQAVENSRALFFAARRAHVRRIVHISVTNPSVDSPFPYFRGKALVERALVETGLPYAIVRPSVIFGEGDVMINNIAWLLRRLPVFAVPGTGSYRVRPVAVEDVARLCVEQAIASDDVVVDAVGPEILSFGRLVGLIREAVGSRARLLYVPRGSIPWVTHVLGLALRDVLLTKGELGGLMAELVTTEGAPTGSVRFSDWVRANAGKLGAAYASELDRHFRSPAA